MKSHSSRSKLKNVLFGIIYKSSIGIFFLYLFYIIAACVIIGTMVYRGIAEDYYFKKTLLEIKSDPAVLDVESGSDIQLTYIIRYVQITYNNGGNLYILNYNARGKEVKRKPMYINNVNNYDPLFYSKDKKNIVRSNNLAIWSAIIGVRLETIVDVTKNYNLISEHIERWSDLSEHKQTKETFWEMMERIVQNNLYSDTIIVDGQEFILYKETKK